MKLGYCAWFFQWQSKCNLCIMLLNAFSGWSQNQLQWQEITRYVSSTLDPIFQTLFACIDKCTTHALIFKGIICITNWQRQHWSKGHHWSTTPTSNNYVHNSWDLTYNVVEYLPQLERKWKPYQGWTPTNSNSFFLENNERKLWLSSACSHRMLDRQLCFSFYLEDNAPKLATCIAW